MTTAAAAAAADAPPDHAGPRQTVLAHTADVALSVVDPVAAAARVSDAVSALGGRLVRGGDRELVVEVPNARYRELVARLARVGELSGEHVTTEDLTDALATAAADGRAAATRRARLEHMKSIAHTLPENLLLERDMESAASDEADADRQIADLHRKGTVTSVTIRLGAPPVEPIAAPKLPFPWLGDFGLPRLLDTATRRTPLPLRLRSFIDGQIDLRAERSQRGGGIGDAAGAISVDASMRGLGDADPVGVFGGFDLALGGGTGFQYRVQGIVGAGAPLGRRFVVGVGSGPGIDGLTSKIPFGVDFPVELYLGIDVASFVGVTAWAQDGWVLAASARKHGARHAPFGDEAALGLGLAFGQRDDYSGSIEREGLRLGFDVREAMDTRIYEITLGFGARQADVSSGNE